MKKLKQKVSVLLTALMVLQPAQHLVAAAGIENPVVTEARILKSAVRATGSVSSPSEEPEKPDPSDPATPSDLKADAVAGLKFNEFTDKLGMGDAPKFTGTITVASGSNAAWEKATAEQKAELLECDTEGLFDDPSLDVKGTTFTISGKVEDAQDKDYTVSIWVKENESVRDKMTVTVESEELLDAPELEFENPSLSVEVGKTVSNTLTVGKMPDDYTAEEILADVEYRSKNEDVAEVTADESGNVTVTGAAAGETTIAASYWYGSSEITAEFTVKVTEAKTPEEPEEPTEPEDKFFVLNADSEITLDLNEEAEEEQKSYTFSVETDYETVTVTADSECVAVREDSANTWTLLPKKTGVANVLVLAKDADGTVGAEAEILVTVQDSLKAVEAESGNAEVDVDGADVIIPEVPKDANLSEAEAQELVQKAQEMADAAKNEIASNEAVNTILSIGFDQKGINDLEKIAEAAGLPKGVKVAIYPVQTLKNVITTLEAVVGADGKTTYRPVINSIKFDINVFAKPEGMRNGVRLNGIKANRNQSFTFPIPVPNGINKKWVELRHYNANGGFETTWHTVEVKNGSKYIMAKVTHFSEFELFFRDSKPSTGGSSGGSGGGGGSSRESYTGRWIQDAKGWWYQYADKSYPAGVWAYLNYNTVSKWYHFDAEGYMQTGWFTDADGNRYYLHPTGDGTRGYMYTGWNQIDGTWYYFTETKTEKNPVGSLMTNTTTPDGFPVDANGVWMQ